MKTQWLVLILIFFTCGLAGCQSQGEVDEIPETPGIEPTAENELLLPAAGVLIQWGNSAEASSEFAVPEWSAEQVIGNPDAPGCGDYQFAWASAASDSIETLIVGFSEEVYPLEINILESFNPDQVVKVEVLDPETGAYYTVLQKNPVKVDRPCPFELKVAVDGINFKTNQVRITVDQSQLGLGWNEIDAVQLIGSVTPLDN